jgi:hypothetical protein
MIRLAGLIATLLAVAGCGIVPQPGASCFVPTFTRHIDDPLPVRMVAVGDGRPCSFSAYLAYGAGNQPLAGGRILAEPKVGTARIIDSDGRTVVAYQAPAGYTGTDEFTVAFGQPAVGLAVAVDVRPAASGSGSPTAAALAQGTPESPFEVPLSPPVAEPGDPYR